MAGKTKDDNLNDRQRRFAEAYLSNGFNASKAAITAGYSAKCATSEGSQLLRNVNVAKMVEEGLTAIGCTPEAVKGRLSEMAFDADLTDFEPFLRGEKTLAELRAEGVNTKLVKSATKKTDKNGTYYKLELYDAQGAIREIDRVLGIVSEGRHIEGKLEMPQCIRDFEQLPDDVRKAVAEASGGPTE